MKMVDSALAIVGLACRYPDADTPDELWQNVLAERRAFRQIPRERLNLEDYRSEDGHPDSLYASRAAVLEGWEFDRVRYRVGSRSFEVADLAHWLALDVAADALRDAGFEHGDGLPRDATGVLLGNTLTGEFSRANLMRLRWPYVRRQMAAALSDEGWEGDRIDAFLADFEGRYKEPFPVTNEESLAGGLANTIAGRIANHFDLHGGGYTVDGACSSSMLALSQACTALAIGDLDVALAGGVDLSLDPFELVGFARAGALARGDMRVFDRRPTGFLPGEGCGVAVLMRYDDAVAAGRRIYAVIRGWGVSSDGAGGLTRPESEGQALALGRAYRRAGFGPDTVAYFEAHGTGTAVGDVAELGALTLARKRASATDRALVGSVKALIGHTKAAAGIAGLIKTSLALHHQVLPPTTGCEEPHGLVAGPDVLLRTARRAEPWPAAAPLRAGVSAMGFGGINSHLVLEGCSSLRRRQFVAVEERLAASAQGAELFVLAAADRQSLADLVSRVRARAPRLSVAELGDLAAALVPNGEEQLGARAAVVARSPEQLEARLGTLTEWIAAENTASRFSEGLSLVVGEVVEPPRVGFLFPGQGSPSHLGGGAWRRRFATVDDLYTVDDLHGAEELGDEDAVDTKETSIAQPAIARASLAGLRVLAALGIRAQAALGHSLGELVALQWAGAWDEEALLRVASARGRAMSELGDATGTMASLALDAGATSELLAKVTSEGGKELGTVGIAATNGLRQTVIAGAGEAVAAAVEKLRAEGGTATRLPVSHAFHSPLVAAAEPRLAAALAADPPIASTLGERRLASTITGDWLDAGSDPSALLSHQITAPVRFLEAAHALSREVDVLVEVGPGRVLRGLISRLPDAPEAFSVDASAPTLDALLETVGALFALGAEVDVGALFADRFHRPYELDREPQFLVNPCELAPVADTAGAPVLAAPIRRPVAAAPVAAAVSPPPSPQPTEAPLAAGSSGSGSILDTVRQIIARRTDLPAETIADGDRMLSDLHLGSIAVGELVTEAARQLDLPPPASPTEYADASVEQLAEALGEIAESGATASAGADTDRAGEGPPEGIGGWVRPFLVEWQAQVRRRRASAVHFELDFAAVEGPPLIAALGDAARQASANGVSGAGQPVLVSILGPNVTEAEELDRLLAAGQRAVAEDLPWLLISPIEGSGGAAAFARCLHLESPTVPVVVLHLPQAVCSDAADPSLPDLRSWAAEALAELGSALAVGGYTEVRLEPEGDGFCRSVPVWKLSEAWGQSAGIESETAEPSVPEALAAGDTVLVSGGGKGIGAECALALARAHGVRLAILGRSEPSTDEELGRNLERFTAHGVDFRYLRADVTDARAVARAIEEAEEALGPIRGLLHSAGTNHPTRVPALRRESMERTLGPKVGGLRNLLAAVARDRLKLVVAFGSIIGRMGLHGEADYALANEVSSGILERFAEEYPSCRALCLEWSVWSGAGMGARLADLDALARQGISPIPVDAGVAALLQLLEQPPSAVTQVVAGRFGEAPTVRVERRELPLHRFLERPRLHVPGVELVVDSELVSDQDPYLDDHVFGGEPLFPAVLGLEAMVRAAAVLSGTEDITGLELADVRFDRPVVVPVGASATLRLVALRTDPQTVEVAVRSSRTEFRVDHFRARVRTGGPAEPMREDGDEQPSERLPLAPAQLYGPVLFQSGRFQRVAGYRYLRATECVAEILPPDTGPWFGPMLPGTLLLGDPGARDATIHAVQACIPHATVLPVSIAALTFFEGLESNRRGEPRFVHAREIESRGRTLIYDLDVRLADGTPVESWRSLELRAVGELKLSPGVAAPLLGPYLQRRSADLLPSAELGISVVHDPGNGAPVAETRKQRGALAVASALGREARLVRRPDGKPELVGEALEPSLSHAGELTLAVVGNGVGCDLEPVEGRSMEVWRDLLGDRFAQVEWLASELNEDRDRVCTRLWTSMESAKKAGLPADEPLVLKRATSDGWALFSLGGLTLASVILPAADDQRPLAVAVVGTEALSSIGTETLASEPALAEGRETGTEPALVPSATIH